jgi:hypothetical protein
LEETQVYIIMSMAMGSKLQLEPGSWMEMAYDIGIGITVGAHHSIYFVARWWHENLIQPILQSIGETDKSFLVNRKTTSLKVVAVGYGRTGTVCYLLSISMSLSIPFNVSLWFQYFVEG